MSAVLHPHHREMLEHDSGIKPDIIEGRGYKTITVKAELKRLGFSDRQCNVPALLIPICNPRGEVVLYQSRPDSPRIKDGKPIKYETPARSSMRLDVHPSMRDKLDDPKVPLFITEGIKKGDALVSHGLTAIALLGVWNWRGTNEHGGKAALPEWEHIALNSRKTTIVFDSDVMEKAAVYGALVRLKAFLESRDATVRLIYLPTGEGAAKCGVDDYLASGKSVDDLLTLATSELKTPRDENSTGPYVIEHGAICRAKWTDEGKVTSPLCNFTARITEQVTRDDGAERSSMFAIEGAAQDGRALPRAEVPTSRFAAMNWPVDEWGNDAVVYAGQGNKDHLRAAIQLTSQPERRTLYTHTGWRNIGGQDVYLHADGATGKDGTQGDVQVELSGELQLFKLPGIPDAVKEAVRKSLALLDLAPDRITAPLVAAPYRAVLGEPDFSLHLAGETGVLKTATAALVQQHFGAGMDAKHLPGSWTSTANALEGLLWLGKDAVTLIDDFNPTGTQYDVARYHAAAERVIRAGANHSARRRMKPDGTLRPDHPPRSLLVSTGEDIPKGHSLRARTLILEVRKGDVDKGKLTAAQAEARAGTYATALAGFISTLAGDLSAYRQRFNELHLAERDSLHTTLPRDTHPRTADIGGQLLATWTVVLEYAQSVQALTADESAAMRARARAGILEALAPQAQHQAASDPVPRFIDLLGALLSSGRAHVATPGGEYPGEGYGWREAVSEAGNSYQRPQGTRLGWLSNNELWLEPDSAYAEASKLARDQNDTLSVTKQTLWKRLAERGITLHGVEAGKTRYTLQRIAEGSKHRVLILGPYPPVQSGESGDEAENTRPEQNNSVPTEENEVGKVGTDAEKVGTDADGKTPLLEPVPTPKNEVGTKNEQETPSQTAPSPQTPLSPLCTGIRDPREKNGEGYPEDTRFKDRSPLFDDEPVDKSLFSDDGTVDTEKDEWRP